MPVGDEDQVDLAERIEILVLLRRLRIGGEEWVNQYPLAFHGGDLHRRVAEPLHLDLAVLARIGARRCTAGDERRCGYHCKDVTQYVFHSLLLTGLQT